MGDTDGKRMWVQGDRPGNPVPVPGYEAYIS